MRLGAGSIGARLACAAAAVSTGGCALSPGQEGIPIVPIVMMAAGLAFLAYGVTLTPAYRRRFQDAPPAADPESGSAGRQPPDQETR
ncbi:hypothetical protein [Chenggangzhangella methanolivorans]|uniref:Lipoprotein n=1 Tax=Chenggangzhangella methanolivorans TaxID=1437009 RepID=A0A9E6UL08_9HYPH|nr:hypothetical protein [Chenggangzhangella methanolivorans]QZN98455.1 hypothetical protein K6K41_15420 [Chenggangzhangella methanolivorans]